MVFSRNPEREAKLLEEWTKGHPAREAAINTGIPEGTTYYYYRRFNRDPEKANRLARSLKPSKKQTPVDIMLQSAFMRVADDVDRKYTELINAGKFVDAENYIKAETERRRLRNVITREVNSITAIYLSDPKRYTNLIPSVAREWVQMEMEDGHSFLESIERLERSLSVLFLFDGVKQQAALFGLAFEDMKKEYTTKQGTQKKQAEPAEGGRATPRTSLL